MKIKLTPRVVAFVAHNEAIVPEAYKDSRGIWTWGMGLATTGGYDVLKYKDNPQPIVVCLRAAIDALNHNFLPALIKAFGNRDMSEAQIAAALSFHWNTGAIGRADWVKDFMRANAVKAEADLRNNYTGEGVLTKRRNAEADLFFRGIWPQPLTTLICDVNRQTYHCEHYKAFDPLPTLQQIMGAV